MPDMLIKTFAENLAVFGTRVDARTAEQLAHYHVLLCAWNAFMNLTGDTAIETSMARLYMDSLAPLSRGELFPQEASVIDVGSGAGFPGLPLAIARPDLRVTLLDSLAKRVAFLREVIARLGLINVQAVHARAEDAARDSRLRETFDVAAARAVAAAPVLLELLLPFVRVGGKTVGYKGPAAADELVQASRAARMLGGGEAYALPVTVPGQPDWKHCVLVCRKLAPTAATYPRKAGMPAREPLGG